MEKNDQLVDKLAQYMLKAFPEKAGLSISALEHISEGWESEVYAFELVSGEMDNRRHASLILRIYPGNDAVQKSGGEFQALRQLEKAGYPVPHVYLLEQAASPFGRPFIIMDKVEGQPLWEPLFHGPPESQARLLSLFCDLFVHLHTLDAGLFARLGQDQAQNGLDTLAYRLISGFRPLVGRTPIAGFEPAFDWALQHSKSIHSRRLSPIHWDFHPGNIILKPDNTASVIDWTQFQLSDYRFDLAWTLLLVGSYEGEDWRARFLAEYVRQAGETVEQAGFFDAVASLKRLFSMIVSIQYGAEKLGMRPGAEEIIRQQVGPMQYYYGILRRETGLRIPEVEKYLAL
jgi:aminoglycoside phosphotransferase (APT) family kinase protein